MSQLGLKPVEDQQIKDLKVSNMQVRTFQSMYKKYNSLYNYKSEVQRAKEHHLTNVRQYEEKKQKLIQEKQQRIAAQKAAEQE